MAYKRTVAEGERYIPKTNKTEQSVQKRVCHYLKMHYPGVQFQSDVLSGLPLLNTDGRVRGLMHALNSDHKHPDLKIFARSHDGQYTGLALELKQEGTTIQLKIGPNKGKIVANEHIREQARTLRQLADQGWYANFACGYDEAIRIIDWYFGQTSLAF